MSPIHYDSEIEKYQYPDDTAGESCVHPETSSPTLFNGAAVLCCPAIGSSLSAQRPTCSPDIFGRKGE